MFEDPAQAAPVPGRHRLAQLVAVLAVITGPGAAAASAESVQSVPGLASYANGVTAGPDGNLYVVEPGVEKVAVFTPGGQLVRQVALPGTTGSAASAAPGPDGQVWVSISGTSPARGFARIDAAGGVTSLTTPYTCGPVGLAAGTPGRMVFTAPDPTGVCAASHGFGGINADGSDPDPVDAINAYDLAYAQGKTWVPDFDADTITRWGMQSPSGYFGTKEAVFSLPAGGAPDGVEIGPGGDVFVTLYNSGQVARVSAAAAGATPPRVVASGLVNPFGMARGSDGALYVASQDARVVRIGPDGDVRSIALPVGFHPWQVAALGDDIWVTDNTAPTLVRIRNAGRDEPAPPATPAPTPPAPVPTPIAAPAPKKPKVADVVSLAATTKCLSRRRLTLTVRKRKTGAKVTSIRVTVGKAKPKTYTARKLEVPVRLTGLPKGTFKVRLTIRLADRTTLTQTRTYRTCAPKHAAKRK
jgi:virginiamycin B lyase